MLWNQAQWNLPLLHLNMKDFIQFSCEGLVDRFRQGGRKVKFQNVIDFSAFYNVVKYH